MSSMSSPVFCAAAVKVEPQEEEWLMPKSPEIPDDVFSAPAQQEDSSSLPSEESKKSSEMEIIDLCSDDESEGVSGTPSTPSSPSLEGLQAQNLTLRKELAGVETELTIYKARFPEVNQERMELVKENEKLKKELKRRVVLCEAPADPFRKRLIKGLEGEVAELKFQNETLDKQIQEVNELYSKQEEAFTKMLQEKEKLEKEREKLHKVLKIQQLQIEAREENIKALKEKMSWMASADEETQRELDTLRNSTSAVVELNEKVQLLEKENEGYLESFNGVFDLKERIKDLEEENKNLLLQIQESEEPSKPSEKESLLEYRLKLKEKELTAKDELIESLKKQLIEARKATRKAEKKVDELKKKKTPVMVGTQKRAAQVIDQETGAIYNMKETKSVQVKTDAKGNIISTQTVKVQEASAPGKKVIKIDINA